MYLGDTLTIQVALQFGNAGDQTRLSLEIPEDFGKSSFANLSLTYGSNLANTSGIVQINVARTQVNVTFGQVEVINNTLGESSENTIDFAYPIYMKNFQNSGHLFNTTLKVEYGADYKNTSTVSRVLSYRGPEVNIQTFKTAGGQSFIFDREMQTSASFEIPPGSWNMSNTQVFVGKCSMLICHLQQLTWA